MSLVLATDYPIADYGQWRAAISKDLPALSRLPAHHVVIYRSIEDDRVFITIGIQERQPLEALLRSPEVFSWLDAAGVEEVPPIFAGQVAEKLSLGDETAFLGVTLQSSWPASCRLRTIDRFWAFVQSQVERLAAAGVRQFWTYRALDDPVEVMILHEIETEAQAERYISHSENVARWMSRAGVGVYPPLFVGRLAEIVDLAKLG